MNTGQIVWHARRRKKLCQKCCPNFAHTDNKLENFNLMIAIIGLRGGGGGGGVRGLVGLQSPPPPWIFQVAIFGQKNKKYSGQTTGGRGRGEGAGGASAPPPRIFQVAIFGQKSKKYSGQTTWFSGTNLVFLFFCLFFCFPNACYVYLESVFRDSLRAL